MRPDRLDENRAAWVAETQAGTVGPALRGAIAADVAVVGAGLTGVSAAWHLAERMPGLGKTPAFMKMDIDEQGRTHGLT